MVTVWIKYDLGGVIKEHTCRFIGEVVAKTIFCGVVDPFLDPNLSFTRLDHLPLVIGCLNVSLILSISGASDIVSGGGESSWSFYLLGTGQITSGCSIHVTLVLTWDHELSDVGL
jgi:hypothetical protein